MKDKKLGQSAAFARPGVEYRAGYTPSYNEPCDGISKRFYAACAAMQGMVSTPGIYTTLSDFVDDRVMSIIIGRAYDYADELLKREEQ